MFPRNITLDEIRSVVSEHNAACGQDLFIEADKGDHVIFNYLISTPLTFPVMTGNEEIDRKHAILRECRGLIMDKTTGGVLARRFHKFFNINERDETQAHLIDWTRPHSIMIKRDGSMITPFFRRGSRTLSWGTKMGETEVAVPVAEFVSRNIDYTLFAIMAIAAGYTPIFEWCSRKQRIVIDYPNDELVLTHMRNMITGEYLTRDKIAEVIRNYDIPLVETINGPISDIDNFISQTRELKGEEGYVIQFEDTGEMYKIKADEYCVIHKAKDALTFEKDVIAVLTSDALDDFLAMMPPDDRQALERFHAALMEKISETAAAITARAEQLSATIEQDDPRERKKAFAQILDREEFGHDFEKALLFRAFEAQSLLEAVLKLVRDNVHTSTKVERARALFGNLHWDDFRHGGVE